MADTLDLSQTTNNDADQVYGARWSGQTFKPTYTAPIPKLELYGGKIGTPAGNATVGIYATSSNLPTGSSLCTATATAANWTVNTWQTFTFVSPYTLTAGTQYAIVLDCSAGDSSNYIRWNCQSSGNVYADGRHCISPDSGGTWANYTADRDATFKTYYTPSVSIKRFLCSLGVGK